jgi:lipopolysaccharide/colanic/teichoic acid biosynthesis glycosyltransferase
MKKILITGATGFLGKCLLNHFNNMDHELILVGRNVDIINQLYPNRIAINYDDMKSLQIKIDVIIHMAVINNNENLPFKSFFKVNVELYKDILNFASKNSVKKVINLTTLHIFTSKNNNYTKSKKLALREDKNYEDLEIYNIFCPMIYGKTFRNKVHFLNLFPSSISAAIFNILSSITPVVNSNSVVKCIEALTIETGRIPRNIYISDDKSKNISFKVFKKVIDISFVIAVILFFWWVFIILWLVIKVSSPGSAIFAQKRIGKNGSLFKCYKFRTMNIGTDNVGTHEVDKNSITRIGKFLRSSKLDELPQIINIIKGDLSLVGPRPGLPNQTELFEARNLRDVYAVLPGITGLSQINNIDMSTPNELAEWDKRYITMRSIPSEIMIIILTFFGRGSGDNVK